MRKYSTKFWIAFVVVSAVFLTAWFVFWELKNGHLSSLRGLVGLLPVSEETKTDLDTVVYLADSLMDTDGEEKTFLILFQNDLELRPGGGFIGSFGILKVRDGHGTHFAVHDTGNFDGRIPDTVLPPYPMKETLGIPSWKFRDSNYAPDFATNAKQAEDFYHMGQGAEQFDGIVGITTDVLSSFLSVTGPIEIEGFPGTYGADNAVIDLERQVEQDYVKQGIAFGERKSVMGILGSEIIGRVKAMPLSQKYDLFRALLVDLHKKNIQIMLRDESLQDAVVAAGWDGAFDAQWKDDYLFLVDANLNSFKSDYFVKRSYDYTVDLTKETPEATLAVTYDHTAQARDWLTKDYQTFLRVYVPKGSYLTSITGNSKPQVYGEFMGKKYFGVLMQVPIASKKTVTFQYALPKDIERDWYDLEIQKQPGLDGVPVHVTTIAKDGTKTEKDFTLDRDTVLSEVK
jgi:hypothetical protein